MDRLSRCRWRRNGSMKLSMRQYSPTSDKSRKGSISTSRRLSEKSRATRALAHLFKLLQSLFKLAAERLNETREERDKLQRIVSESESVEKQLLDLTTRRTIKQETMAIATELAEKLEKFAAQAAGVFPAFQRRVALWEHCYSELKPVFQSSAMHSK
jgi:hypothetical protein